MVSIEKIVTFVVIVLSSFGAVFAVTGSSVVTNITTSSSYGGVDGTNNVTAQAGNVTQVDITADLSTTKWQGFYGNITSSTGNASLILGDASRNVFFNFANTANPYVIATTSASFGFGDLYAGNATEIDTAWNFTGNVPDLAVEVFSNTENLTDGEIFDIADVPYVNITANFTEYILKSNATGVDQEDMLFVTKVVAGGAEGFDSNSYGYELLVPVYNEGTQVYYFYLTLD
jgi:hypothetical protein